MYAGGKSAGIKRGVPVIKPNGTTLGIFGALEPAPGISLVDCRVRIDYPPGRSEASTEDQV
jgi:hypothetical protein